MGSDVTLFYAQSPDSSQPGLTTRIIEDKHGVTLSGCTIVRSLEVWDETTNDWWPQLASGTPQPLSSWLQLTSSDNVQIESSAFGAMPAPTVTYTLRAVYYVSQSKYGTEAYLYD